MTIFHLKEFISESRMMHSYKHCADKEVPIMLWEFFESWHKQQMSEDHKQIKLCMHDGATVTEGEPKE